MSLSKGPGFFLKLEERVRNNPAPKPTCCCITDPCSGACVDDWIEWERDQNILQSFSPELGEKKV